MRFTINDRFIRGTVAFDEFEGGRARMSYVGNKVIPANAQYELNGKMWRVVATHQSDYNEFVYNVDLELVSG